ncbi:hypothetical protein PRZ48_008368 [Zasmidium cellare]|uniref:Uncharacterized protein n=1 Tax=Zasmidium cellare TaxID=395010 RepID=A0ABR0EFB9_ZASCE|nr:hypothetical protein PRZ48_008368 [Zasmidium cellare]
MAFSGKKPWVAQTPDEILSAYNATGVAQQQRIQGSNPYGVLKLKVSIFYKDLILLMRGGDAWAVPTMKWTTGDGDQTCILKQIVARLKQGGLPPDLLNELQFTDLSHIYPLAATNRSSLPNTPSEVKILHVLTTTHPAKGDVADEEEFDLSPEVKFRWVSKNTLDSINLAMSLPKLNIEQARQRLVSSSKAILPTRLDDSNRWTFCFNTILGILQTRAIVEGTADPGYGVVAVSEEDAEGQMYVKLMKRPMRDFEAAKFKQTTGHRYGQSTGQVTRLMIIGRWKGEDIEWLECFDGWESVIDSSGRLRKGNGEEWM